MFNHTTLHTFEGLPVYVQPLLPKGTVEHRLKNTPQEHVLVDSMDTLYERIPGLIKITGLLLNRAAAARGVPADIKSWAHDMGEKTGKLND